MNAQEVLDMLYDDNYDDDNDDEIVVESVCCSEESTSSGSDSESDAEIDDMKNDESSTNKGQAICGGRGRGRGKGGRGCVSKNINKTYQWKKVEGKLIY